MSQEIVQEENVVETPEEQPEEELELDLDLEEETESETDSNDLAKQLAEKEAKIKKLEALIIKNKKASKPQETQTTLTEEAIEKKILKSQGMPDELIAGLEKVAKVTGKPMLDAQSDSVFLAIKRDYEENQRKAKANLGASKGSGQVKSKLDTTTPNISDDEHKRLWKESMGL